MNSGQAYKCVFAYTHTDMHKHRKKYGLNFINITDMAHIIVLRVKVVFTYCSVQRLYKK